ncbi:MAG: hypothetical protein IJH39_12465 [Clostridia bacterium]|nr:hypothetical protein [Clostridia bacterium]
MKKRILVISLALMLVLSLGVLTGCGNNSNNSGNVKQTQQSKGNYDVFEAIKKIETTTTFEDVNKLLGFEGTLKSQSDANSTYSWKLYRWDLTDDTAIEVRINDKDNSASIEAKYPTDMIRNGKVDFSKVNSEMKKKINEKDGMTYDQVVEMLGGVQGTLDKKDSSTDTYVWANAQRGSLTVRFSTSTGKATSFNGLL